MSRWRPPAPQSSNYISFKGAKKLKTELTHLWKVERPQVTQVVSEAAKNGDRSENGDYIYGKQRLREIDRRVRYLTKRLDEVTVVDKVPTNQSKIFFGACVSLSNLDDGSVLEVTLLGADEIDSEKNYISIDSPMAKALLGRSLDDEISITIGERHYDYRIEAIEYC